MRCVAISLAMRRVALSPVAWLNPNAQRVEVPQRSLRDVSEMSMKPIQESQGLDEEMNPPIELQ